MKSHLALTVLLALSSCGGGGSAPLGLYSVPPGGNPLTAEFGPQERLAFVNYTGVPMTNLGWCPNGSLLPQDIAWTGQTMTGAYEELVNLDPSAAQPDDPSVIYVAAWDANGQGYLASLNFDVVLNPFVSITPAEAVDYLTDPNP